MTIRTKKSLYNTIASIFSLMIPSLLSLVLTNQILFNYGSDVNGIFVTINQIIALLVLLEGGFTLATNVALFKPYNEKSFDVANSILSATSKAFNIVGIIYGSVTIILAIMLPNILKSNVANETITQLLLLASLNTLYSFFFEYKLRVLFQTSQQEYVILMINAISSFIGYGFAILAVWMGYSIVIVRIALLVPILLRFPIILYLHKKKFPWVRFNAKPDFKAIKGTVDVFVQKLSDILFFNTPVIVIAIVSGTMYASVYAIYNSIYSLIRNIIYSFVMAPYNAFGQMIVENGKKSIIELFHIYQLIVMVISSILLSTTTILILPFIRVFTKNVNDVNYIDSTIAFLFLISGLLEIIHISSRGILNISGNFKFLKKVVTFAALVNVIISIILTQTIGIYGVIWGTIAGYFVLTPLTVYYTHVKFLECGFQDFISIVIPNVIMSIVMVLISFKLNLQVNNYGDFLLKSILVLAIVSILTVSINFIFNNKLMCRAVSKLLTLKKSTN